jgi:type IV pilus biogenesis protein PilP
MNNYHSRKTPFGVKAALAVLIASAAISTANAQEVAPLQPNNQGELVLPGAAPAAPGAVAKQPDFKLPEGASVGDANEKIKKLSSEGGKSLKDLVGASVDNERENVDVEARSGDKREIEALKSQVEKAKLAKELYQVINGDDDKNKAELESVTAERDELSVQVKSLEEQLVQTSKQVQTQTEAGGEPNPVIVSITGAGGNLNARLLVPYYGETTVHKGDVLANGQTVSSITSNGVTVSRDGQSYKLAFGTSVPAAPRR